MSRALTFHRPPGHYGIESFVLDGRIVLENHSASEKERHLIVGGGQSKKEQPATGYFPFVVIVPVRGFGGQEATELRGHLKHVVVIAVLDDRQVRLPDHRRLSGNRCIGYAFDQSGLPPDRPCESASRSGQIVRNQGCEKTHVGLAVVGVRAAATVERDLRAE